MPPGSGLEGTKKEGRGGKLGVEARGCPNCTEYVRKESSQKSVVGSLCFIVLFGIQ